MRSRKAGWTLALLVTLTPLAGPVLAQSSRPRGGSEAQRDQWQRVDEIFAAMALAPGAVVADVGAGGGYFTSRLSRAVGAQGRVYAVDIKTSVVNQLRARATEEGLSNVEVVQGASDDPRLPVATLDAALIVNAYHEMAEHQAILVKLKAALIPGGRLVIVEPISASHRDDSRQEQERRHEIAVDFVRQDAREVGFVQVRLEDPFLTRQGDGDDEWLLVLSPKTAETEAAEIWSSKNEAWRALELRISVEDFKRLVASNNVLVLDVRDAESDADGHLPGAVLMPFEDLSKPETLARLGLVEGRAYGAPPPERSGAKGPPRATALGGPGDEVPGTGKTQKLVAYCS
jgi:predicted methyltransferase/rhodanese-related sulfurtransferase